MTSKKRYLETPKTPDRLTPSVRKAFRDGEGAECQIPFSPGTIKYKAAELILEQGSITLDEHLNIIEETGRLLSQPALDGVTLRNLIVELRNHGWSIIHDRKKKEWRLFP